MSLTSSQPGIAEDFHTFELYFMLFHCLQFTRHYDILSHIDERSVPMLMRRFLTICKIVRTYPIFTGDV